MMHFTNNVPLAASLRSRGDLERRTPLQMLRAKAEALVRRIAAWRRYRRARLELEAMSEY